ncbi:MAG TPA: uroporphyrinogen-III C-methyltransferase [Bryobacteraceae bacterium]|nr:uroporphyrinogen-III C-methyltransferase [Bryobacteraceae bacterium]
MSKVYLVGAGPGDPELITVKARRLLENADCILYDHLASSDLLDLAPPSAERIYVGKKKAEHALAQEEICALLVDRGKRGLNVVRLKGGDPFIFGRGGEEAEALADAGVPFEIVPGVTSPLGIAAYTGVPLTHRDHTSVVTFITGHDVLKIDWSKVGTSETLVIFMGLSQFDEIARRIIAGGRAAATPAMAARWGTRPDQEVLTGTLETLPELIHKHALKPPATIIVGDVVRLRDKLNWYENLPLFGRRIVVTRAREQAGELSALLHNLGAEVIELPTIEIKPADDYGPLDQAIARLDEYGWLIFTSANGVRFFLDRLDRSRLDLRAIQGRICAIGPATRDALERFHLKVDCMAERYVAEGLLDAMAAYDLSGSRILIARAAVARDLLPTDLTRRGAIVDVIEAYRTSAPAGLAHRAADILSRKPDWITFTSSSTVKNLVSATGVEALQNVNCASIGPVTTATLRENGVPVAAEAVAYTVPGLVQALLNAAGS